MNNKITQLRIFFRLTNRAFAISDNFDFTGAPGIHVSEKLKAIHGLALEEIEKEKT